MRIQIVILAALCAGAFSVPVSTDTFSSLDREIAGLMDAWIGLQLASENGGSGLFNAQNALIRAEAMYYTASISETDRLPDQVAAAWNRYLKASADCIFSCRTALENPDSEYHVEFMLASFTRWENSGEEFLSSVQSIEVTL